MGIGLKNRLAVGATPVPDVFIDTYMAGASGEYVKVYLYLLRHQQEEVSIGQIADALNHTEADVQRALAYWQRAGVLGTEVGEEAQRSFQETSPPLPHSMQSAHASPHPRFPRSPAYSA